jgi:ATP-dependent DNA helicase RecQ
MLVLHDLAVPPVSLPDVTAVRDELDPRASREPRQPPEGLAAPGIPELSPRALDQALRDRFQLERFRPGQREAIEALLFGEGKVLLVAPTGGGKSLTYQLPATVLPGLTVVVSPLVALMEDQVRSLRARGIEATFLASTLDAAERRDREARLARGEYTLLYCAPERLASDWFVDLIVRCRPALVAIDEAHCISQWGHDFRPDYLRIRDFIDRTAPPRVLACTATATPRVRAEIIAQLGLEGCFELVRGFARPNLHLEARWVDGKKDGRKAIDAALERGLGSPRAPKGAAIVYCATRKVTEQLAAEIADDGYRCAAYHAGLEPAVRADVNARFAAKELDVVVATNAFGMGIDRSDVRVVVHAQPPTSLEAYYQEVGRGGRDGEDAHGLLLCSGSDVAVRRRLCELGSDGPAAPEVVARQWGLFRELMRYLDARTCRHDFILRYFEDEQELLGGCGHCDVCEGFEEDGAEEASEDAAVEVRKALAGVARAQRRGGMIAVAEMLRGEASERVLRFGFDKLSTYGLLSHRTQPFMQALLRALIAAGWIDLTPDEHPVPYVTDVGWRVMKGTGPVRLRLPSERLLAGAAGAAAARGAKRARPKGPKREKKPIDAEALTDGEESLFEALRARRAEIAKGRGVPAYVVAHDATLLEMARLRPSSRGELLAVRGMGEQKVERYGEEFLAVLNAPPAA